MTPLILRIVFVFLFGRRAQWPRWLKFRPPGMHMASGGPPSILSRGEHFLPLFTAWVKNSRLNPKCSFFVIFVSFLFLFFSGKPAPTKKDKKGPHAGKSNLNQPQLKTRVAIRPRNWAPFVAMLAQFCTSWTQLGGFWVLFGARSAPNYNIQT